MNKPDLSGCEVMVDGEGIQLESGKPFNFTCCDCGLTHRCVIVSEDGKPVDFALERDMQVTAERRGITAGSPSIATCTCKGWECATCEKVCTADPYETREARYIGDSLWHWLLYEQLVPTGEKGKSNG